jgi:hypothetical protein
VGDQIDEDMMPAPECSGKEEDGTYQTQYGYEDGEMSVKNVSMKLLCLMVTETLRQVEESYGTLRGPLSLPSAVAGFWMGLAGRMTCLAIVTLFPQVMQKMDAISEPVQSQLNQV